MSTSKKCQSKKIMLSSFCAISALLASAAMPAYATENDAVMQQLKAMQKQIEMQNAKINSLQSKIKEQEEAVTETVNETVFDYLDEYQEANKSPVRVGGNAGVMYMDNDKATGGQTFNPSFEVFFDTRIDDNWGAFIEFSGGSIFESSGNGTEGAFEVERVYLSYDYSDQVKLKFGKNTTQFGLWNREHWLPVIDSISQPMQHTNKYIPLFQNGVSLAGTADLGKDVDYAVWVSTGDKVAETDANNPAGVGYGLDINSQLTDNIMFGTSFYTQNNSAKTGPAGRYRKEATIVPYASIKLNDFTWDTEYMFQQRNEGYEDIELFYSSLKYQVNPKTYVYYRLDKGDDDLAGTGTVRTSHIFTASYKPVPKVGLKVEYSDNSYNKSSVEDYSAWMAYIGMVF